MWWRGWWEPCGVCHAAEGQQLLPNRAPDNADGHPHHWLCPLCLDGLLALFPLMPARLHRREVLGRFPSGAELRRTPPRPRPPAPRA